jgi:hypothetical protein
MNIKEAELLFQAGVLETPLIKKDDHGGSWTVTLTRTHQLNPQIRDCARTGAGV